MDLKSTQKTVSLLYRIVGNREKEIPCVPYYPQKTAYCEKRPIDQAFPRALPESQGIDSDLLADFLEDVISHQEQLLSHTILVLRHGSVIAECTFAPYEQEIWHITHSMCKSITSLAIGMLIDENKLSLDTRLIDLFPNKVGSLAAIRKKELTVRHLLTMSSGAALNEAGSVTEEDWLKAYLESGQSFKPGSEFHYNSMNTYMLSEIVRQLSGKTLSEYLSEKLFTPLGISNFLWEKSPSGAEKGGWGLYILPEDAAKIGQLILNGGVWNGKRILSEKYLWEATTKQISSAEHMNDFGYGYQIWMSKRIGAFQFNGMLGQNVFIMPDLDMVIVTTAGNGELFPKSLMSDLVSKYFGDGFRPKAELQENPAAYARLQDVIHKIATPHLKHYEEMPAEALALNGISYHMYTKNTLFMPLFLQCMQNNHSKGITEISFTIENDCFYLEIHEHDDHYRIPVGFGTYRETLLDFHGEPYLVKATGTFTTDEDDNPVFKVHIPFIETANARCVKFFFLNHGKKLKAVWSETPDMEEISGVDKVVSSSGGSLVSSIVQKATEVDSDILRFLIQRSIAPVGFGECISAPPAALFQNPTAPKLLP